MKKLFFSSVVAMVFLTSCVNESKEQSVDTVKISNETPPPLPPPPPLADTVVDFSSMETPPKYPGGFSAFYKFIGDNLKYPDIAKEKKLKEVYWHLS